MAERLDEKAKAWFSVRGHPFMTTTRRGEGQAQVDACGRGRGVSAMWTSTQKIRTH